MFRAVQHAQPLQQHPFLLLQHARRRLFGNNNATTTVVVVNPTTGEIQSTCSNSSSNHSTTHRYQLVIGLELHAQLDVATKLFSPAANSNNNSTRRRRSTTPANQQIHPFDVAVPGLLPVVNAAAVQRAVVAAAALQCTTIAPVSRFERKHYVYADLPHGYQITQQRWPLARDGRVTIDADDDDYDVAVAAAASSSKRKKKKKQQSNTTTTTSTRIERVQLEIDTAKTVDHHRIDGNRAGCPLIEIVTAPDIRSPTAAARVVTTIRSLLQHTQSCDGRMEHGHLRVDCNVNIMMAKRSSSKGGEEEKEDGGPENDDDDTTSMMTPRVEIKNLNSVAQVHDAILYEAERQTRAVVAAAGGTTSALLYPETRTWNAARHATEVLRRKDQADDYRFLPEPDLPPLQLDATTLGGSPDLDTFLRDHVPELPAAIRARYQALGLAPAVAHQLSQDPYAVRLFDAALASSSSSRRRRRRHPAVLANLICNELTALVASDTMEDCKITAQQLGTVVDMLDRQDMSKTMAKHLLEVLYTMATDDPSTTAAAAADPVLVAQQHGFQLVTATEPLQELCRTVIAQHPEEFHVYQRGGKFVGKMEKFFTGKAMKASQGNAHPERLGEILKDCLRQAAAEAQHTQD